MSGVGSSQPQPATGWANRAALATQAEYLGSVNIRLGAVAIQKRPVAGSAMGNQATTRRTSGIFSAPYGHVRLSECLTSPEAQEICNQFHVKSITDIGFEYALYAQPLLVVADEECGPPGVLTLWIVGRR